MSRDNEEKYLAKIKDLEEKLEEHSKASKNHRSSIQLTSWKLDSISKEKEALTSELIGLKKDIVEFEHEISKEIGER
jgi:flagellar biosynthesis/type III secretory pathway chaperone